MIWQCNCVCNLFKQDPYLPLKRTQSSHPVTKTSAATTKSKSGSCSTISWRKDLHQIATQQTIIAAQLVFCHLAMQNPTQNGCSIPLSKILSPSVQDVLIKGLIRSIAVSEKYVYIYYMCVYELLFIDIRVTKPLLKKTHQRVPLTGH